MSLNNEFALIGDAAADAKLRDVADAAETASAAEAPVKLDTTSTTAYWETAQPAFNGMAIGLYIKSLTTAGGETYTIDVEVADDQAFTTNVVKVGSLTPTKVGQYAVVLHGPTVRQLANKPQWIRVNLTAAGASPSIEYGAWITQTDGVV